MSPIIHALHFRKRQSKVRSFVLNINKLTLLRAPAVDVELGAFSTIETPSFCLNKMRRSKKLCEIKEWAQPEFYDLFLFVKIYIFQNHE